MGKETKIGLAVVGVLLVVFGGLLFRKLTMSDYPAAPTDEPAVAASSPPAALAAKPQVVSQNHTEPGGQPSSSQPAWARGVRERDPDRGDAPRAVYMPDEAAPVSDAADDRYANHPSRQAADDKAPVEASSNPFRRRGAPPSGVDPQADSQRDAEGGRGLNDASREPSAQRTPGERQAGPRRNPVRQASALEPIADADDSRLPPLGAVDSATDPSTTTQADPQTLEPRVAFDNDPPASAAGGVETSNSSVDPPSASGEAPVDAPIARQAAVPAQWQAGGAAGSLPAADTDPAPPANGRYTVQPNDSLWSISEKVYGTGRYFKAIYEHNRAKLPRADKLTVGTVINVPSTSLLEQNYPSLCPKQRKSALVKPRTLQASTHARAASREDVYVVEEGDTLFDIARYELGKASRWNEIYELNRETLGDDFDYLQPGTQLALPPKSPATDSFTRQRESKIQR